VQTNHSWCHVLGAGQAACFEIVQVPSGAQQTASGSLVGHGVVPGPPKPRLPYPLITSAFCGKASSTKTRLTAPECGTVLKESGKLEWVGE
jgi:hypothetical protein